MSRAQQDFPVNSHARAMPPSARKDTYSVDVSLYESQAKWLKAHGKGMRPHLSDLQKAELETVFHLMDEDGSGSIDTVELSHAFKILGFRLTKTEIQELVDEVDHDHTGVLEWTEFVEIFLETLRRLSEEKREEEEGQELSSKSNQVQVPLALMATAYRRKKILGGILECSSASLAAVVKAGEDDKARTKAREVKEREIKSHQLQSNEYYKGVSQQTLQAVVRASSMNPHDLLDLFSLEELKAVAESANKQSSTPPPESPKHLMMRPTRLPPLPHLNTSSSSPHIPALHSPLRHSTSKPSSPGPNSPGPFRGKTPRALQPSSFGEEWDRLTALTTLSQLRGGNDSMVIPIKSSRKTSIMRSKTGIL